MMMAMMMMTVMVMMSDSLFHLHSSQWNLSMNIRGDCFLIHFFQWVFHSFTHLQNKNKKQKEDTVGGDVCFGDIREFN